MDRTARAGTHARVATDDFTRAFTLLDVIDDAVAERVEPTEHGVLVLDTRLFHVHDRNFLRVQDPGDASAVELADEAEAAQGRHAQLRHRRVNLRSDAQSARLEPGFSALGWKPEWFVLMVRRNEPDRPGEARVLEVDAPALRPVWADGIRDQPHGRDDDVVEQILEHHGGIGEAVPTRYFGVEADGRLVAHCELYSEGGTGQVENVATLRRYRGRGFARALVLHAADVSRAVGNELTFLVADAEDWPRKLYEKLGFEPIGRYARFLKRLPVSP
jgi:ribosomal protein S18 acetylase RimI-like enzyme